LAEGRQFVNLINAILRKELLPARKAEGAGISGLLFPAHDFRKWLRQESAPGRISVVEAAECLGIKQEVAYSLVKKGIIISERILVGRNKQTLITQESLTLFRSTYIDAAAIAKINNTSPRSVVNNLNSLGIRPITGSSIDGCRQYFFERQDLIDVDHKFVVPMQ
jgi:hypothetical protein